MSNTLPFRGAQPEEAQAAEPVSHHVVSLKPPEWLPAEAAGIWTETAQLLSQANMLSTTDAHMLALYCRTWLQLESAQADIDAHGLVYTAISGMRKPNPAVSIAQRAQQQLRAILNDLGLGPAARKRVIAGR